MIKKGKNFIFCFFKLSNRIKMQRALVCPDPLCIALYFQRTRPTAIIRNPHQFFVEDCDYSPSITVELDGNLTLNAESVTWSFRPQDLPQYADKPIIDEPNNRITNVTIGKTPGQFKFKLKAQNSRGHDSAHSYVIIEVRILYLNLLNPKTSKIRKFTKLMNEFILGSTGNFVTQSNFVLFVIIGSIIRRYENYG